MILESERLRFSELDTADAAFVFELVNDPAWIRYIGDMSVKTLDDARAYLEERLMSMYPKHGHGLYRVDLKDRGEPIGICGLIKRPGLDNIDLGFATLPQFRRLGYTTEAAKAMMAHGASEHGLTKLAAITHSENHASRDLLEKLGFRFERMVELKADGYQDRLYAIDLTASLVSLGCDGN